MTSSPRLRQVYEHSRLNRQFITPGVACRCFYCLRSFAAEEIIQWIDEGTTALCPYCSVDSVLSSSADPLSDALIQQLHTEYFGSSRKYTDEEWRRDMAEKRRRQQGAVTGSE